MSDQSISRFGVDFGVECSTRFMGTDIVLLELPVMIPETLKKSGRRMGRLLHKIAVLISASVQRPAATLSHVGSSAFEAAWSVGTRMIDTTQTLLRHQVSLHAGSSRCGGRGDGVVRKPFLQEAETKNHRQRHFLARGDAEVPDARDRYQEDREVGKEADDRGEIPDRQRGEAPRFRVRVESGQRDASQGEEDNLDDRPDADKYQQPEADTVEHLTSEDATVL